MATYNVQGHDKSRYFEEESSSSDVMSIIKKYSLQYGIPTHITSSIVEVESTFNPTAVGDAGASFGLLQLYTKGGQGNGYTKEQMFDPATNLQIGLPYIRDAYQQGVQKGLSGYALLEYTAGHSGHPSHNGTFTSGYQSMLKRAYENGDELSGVSGGGSLGSSYPTADPAKWLTGDTQGLDPQFAGRLAKLGEDLGEKISVTSGHRSVEEQQRLWDQSDKSGKWVARPGGSRHNYGFAIDVGNAKVKAMSNSQLAKYGLHKPMDYENWHIEPVETKGLSIEGIKSLSQKGLSMVSGFINRVLNRNGAEYDDETAGAFTLFKQLDEVTDFGTDNPLNPIEFIADNTKATATRGLIVFIGIVVFIFGLVQMVNVQKSERLEDIKEVIS